MVYEQQKFILSFGDWKAQDQGSELSRFFNKGTNVVMGPPTMVESPPKGPTAEYHHSVGLSSTGMGEANMLSSEGLLQLLGASPAVC